MYLIFDKLEFLPGINLTVRRGTKWSERDFHFISDVSSSKVITIQVKTKQVMRFCDLTDADLVCEHDSGCRTIYGLYNRLLELYADFDQREIVTLIFFKVLGTHPF